MRKKSHIALAMHLVRELNMEGLFYHKRAFCFGSILPDMTPKMVTSPHEFETSYGEIQNFIRYIFTEGIDNEWKERVLWRRIGFVLHYIADYFTFPHNTSFGGSLKDHCMYESKLKYCLRDFVRTPEAGEIFKQAQRIALTIGSLEELFTFIEEMHCRYMQRLHSVEDDCRQILMNCAVTLVALAEKAYVENMVSQPLYRCA